MGALFSSLAFTLYTLHSTPYTLHFTLYTLHSTLYTKKTTKYAFLFAISKKKQYLCGAI